MSRRLFSQMQNDDAEEQEDDHVKSALPISKSKAQLVNGQPVSGEDYLLMVRDQANKYPKTVTAAAAPPPPSTNSSLPASFAFFQEPEPTSEFLLPDPVWQQEFANSFKIYQEYKQKNKPRKGKVTLPTNWRAHCYDSEADQERLNIIAHCSQRNILSLLRGFRDWLTEMTHTESLWLYTLLVYLDPVMMAQHVSVLRELARKCIKIRNTREMHDDNVVRLNMIITIIAKVFGQADMV
ncbi:survival motor neuron interacting protein 1-domain-containing protein [Zychaea mexicana]|uniref:survival motor neuron interacting protein 1-domain-containing protein n=1 Tax=Zychaea mexicana TaxID=64656 RepID=UPI0022FEA16F|nr:survival motor neuron interacting protein 1-domain-containing protein [Zychaea mexicana]KAI9492865.1 survival motor neuron interacting protein 1-domain-containing protein [Zychaea mexicana]